MGAQRHGMDPPELEPIVEELRAAVPERSALELDRLKTRVLAQASRAPSAHELRPKGIFMKRRNLLTPLLMAGLLMSTIAFAAILSGLPAPLERMGDAALAQYGGSSDGSSNNNNGGGGSDGGEDESQANDGVFDPESRIYNGVFVPPPGPTGAGPSVAGDIVTPPLGRGTAQLHDCGLFEQNFEGNSVKLLNCVVATDIALRNRELTPAAACAQVGFMNDELPEGFKRNDFAACIRAVELGRAAADKVS